MLDALAATDSELEDLVGSVPLRRRFTRAQMLVLAVGLAISGAFMYVAVRDAQPRQTFGALRTMEYVWLPAGLVLLAAAFFIRAIRWQSLFPQESRPALRHVTAALFVGYVANAVLPLRAGDAVAVVALSRRADRTIAETTATALVQRAQDVLSLVLLLFLMLPWLPPVSWLRAAGLIALALLVFLALLLVTVLRFGDRAAQLLLRPLRALPFVPAESVERAPRQFVQGLGGLLSVRVALVSFAWTTLSWVVLGIGFWLVMEANALALSPLAGLLVVIGIGLAMILPSSPAALGVFEGATVVVLSAYGVDASAALSYALVLHALNVVPLLVVALALALRRQVQSGSRQAPSAFEP
jgi:glycosyltransferase 2 family protein